MFAWRRAIKRSVVVNLKTDKAFRGVLWSKRGPLLIVRQATLYDSGRQLPMDGEVIVERANVDFIQVLERIEGP